MICGKPPDGHVEKAPSIVVEVLSDATRERDKVYKRALYQKQRVPWYLIADPTDTSLQILRLDPNNRYVPVPFEAICEIMICQHCRLDVDLSHLSP